MVILALALAFPVAAVLAQESGGEVVFNNACRTCHTMREGDNRLGPTLAGIMGRKAGSLPDYAFSESLKKSDITWDEATLDKFIENPDAVVPGNNMKPYSGMSSAEDRKKVVAFLKANGAK